jgi:hypothetical protein
MFAPSEHTLAFIPHQALLALWSAQAQRADCTVDRQHIPTQNAPGAQYCCSLDLIHHSVF